MDTIEVERYRNIEGETDRKRDVLCKTTKK